MSEIKKLTDSEKKEFGEKMDEVFDTTSDMVLKDVEKILGRDLTDDEKKELCTSLKSYFVLISFCIDIFADEYNEEIRGVK
jgi:hypothetical protein